MFDKPWYRDPVILIRRPLEFFPTRDMSSAERLNSIVRFVVYASAAIAMYRAERTPLWIGGVVILVVSLAFVAGPTAPGRPADVQRIVVEDSEERAECTPPTANNPFMNVLANEYGTDKPGACKVTSKSMKASQRYFDQDLPREISDVYRTQASDRQFVTMPASGSQGIPDTLAFRNFLFSNTARGTNCK